MAEKSNRRSFLGKTLLGATGVSAAYGLEENILLTALGQEADGQPADPPDAGPGEMPCGKIGDVKISRLLLGGNLIGGWAHARDLLYASQLFKAYNTDEKVFETIALAEQCGVNTIQADPRCQAVINKYNRQHGGNMQTLVCFNPQSEADHLKKLIDDGATLLYTHGEETDHFTMSQKTDVLGKAIDTMKAQGLPAGIGSHSLQTPMACEKNNLGADFYVKTFHMDRYWSATPEENREQWCWYKGQSADHDGYHDNMWCLDPEKTAAFMETVEKPWFAFKVMAAGAIHPRVGFSHAFRNGADFVVAGMFDFQLAYDAKLAKEVLAKLDDRKRPWRA